MLDEKLIQGVVVVGLGCGASRRALDLLLMAVENSAETSGDEATTP
ncbi:MAG: hypothetical protein JW892_17495 [Anaerolineae bacterium]|nr:hypothetical protein [Anaerolineae bacterium]